MSEECRWQKYLTKAIDAAREAGKVLLKWREKFTISEKGRSDLVTDADFDAQKTIEKILSEAFPTHSFLGEEGLERTGAESDYRWIIDPLDGTMNYVHGFPYYCVSIALEYKGKIVVAAIYDPTRDDLFHACENTGTYYNGERVRVSGVEKLSDSLCIASLPVAGDAAHPAVKKFLAVLPVARTVQRLGSAAMNLAYLSCGRADVYWSSTLKPWDMAAGILLVQEAGGEVTRLDGSPYDIYTGEILATCSNVVKQDIIPLLCSD